jgi:hypothetical protein
MMFSHLRAPHRNRRAIHECWIGDDPGLRTRCATTKQTQVRGMSPSAGTLPEAVLD